MIFEHRKYFIPRREIRSVSSGGPIDTLSIHFVLGKCCTFKNPLAFLWFLNLENVLSPEGRYVVYPVREIHSISSRGPIEVSFHLLNFELERVYWTSKTWILRREIRSITSRGPINVSFHLLDFGLERVYWTSKTYVGFIAFFLR